MYISDLPAGTPGAGAELAYDTGSATYKTGLPDLYHGMMKASGAYTFYNSVEALGMTVGAATIAGAYSAMPNYSILIVPHSYYSSGQYPYGFSGPIEIVKSTPHHGYIVAHSHDESVGDYRMYLNNNNEPTGTWVPVAHGIGHFSIQVIANGATVDVGFEPQYAVVDWYNNAGTIGGQIVMSGWNIYNRNNESVGSLTFSGTSITNNTNLYLVAIIIG